MPSSMSTEQLNGLIAFITADGYCPMKENKLLALDVKMNSGTDHPRCFASLSCEILLRALAIESGCEYHAPCIRS